MQDTPDVVQQHYGRFLPQDKSALANIMDRSGCRSTIST